MQDFLPGGAIVPGKVHAVARGLANGGGHHQPGRSPGSCDARIAPVRGRHRGDVLHGAKPLRRQRIADDVPLGRVPRIAAVAQRVDVGAGAVAAEGDKQIAPVHAPALRRQTVHAAARPSHALRLGNRLKASPLIRADIQRRTPEPIPLRGHPCRADEQQPAHPGGKGQVRFRERIQPRPAFAPVGACPQPVPLAGKPQPVFLRQQALARAPAAQVAVDVHGHGQHPEAGPVILGYGQFPLGAAAFPAGQVQPLGVIFIQGQGNGAGLAQILHGHMGNEADPPLHRRIEAIGPADIGAGIKQPFLSGVKQKARHKSTAGDGQVGVVVRDGFHRKISLLVYSSVHISSPASAPSR